MNFKRSRWVDYSQMTREGIESSTLKINTPESRTWMYEELEEEWLAEEGKKSKNPFEVLRNTKISLKATLNL